MGREAERGRSAWDDITLPTFRKAEGEYGVVRAALRAWI
jgi:hypothetical protein